jgi:hypothetical protein
VLIAESQAEVRGFLERHLAQDGIDVLGTDDGDAASPAQLVLTRHFEPWQMGTIELTGRVPHEAHPGQVFAFRVVQRAGRMVTGGYTVHVVLADR